MIFLQDKKISHNKMFLKIFTLVIFVFISIKFYIFLIINFLNNFKNL